MASRRRLELPGRCGKEALAAHSVLATALPTVLIRSSFRQSAARRVNYGKDLKGRSQEHRLETVIARYVHRPIVGKRNEVILPKRYRQVRQRRRIVCHKRGPE